MIGRNTTLLGMQHFCSGLLACLIVFSAHAEAQQEFELVAPAARTSSRAVLETTLLRIEGSDGSTTTYLRDQSYDSPDGQWRGFFSRQASQVIRWPVVNSGNLQIGTIAGGRINYRTSQMTIRPIGQQHANNRPVLPPSTVGQPLVGTPHDLSTLGSTNSQLFTALEAGRYSTAAAERLRMANVDERGLTWLLSHSRLGGLRGEIFRTGSNIDSQEIDWWIAPSVGDLVRIEALEQGQVLAVGVQGGGLALSPIGQDTRQLWRPVFRARVTDRFVFESVHLPGHCLSLVGGQIALQPINFTASQWWVPIVPPPVIAFQPLTRTVRQEVIPNAALPPAQVELINSHRYALITLIGDRRDADSVTQVRIEPNTKVVVSLERDPGARLVETFELQIAPGQWERQEFVTELPPSTRYDLSVYEEHLQSIAIDRTGKSPNPIEDTNFVPKSVGWLLLPAELQVTMQIDVYPTAVAANNPGAVRKFDFRAQETNAGSPLDTILNEFQNPKRRSF
ncbi:MAG: hypothetical protein KDB22_09345 [Planctomycetales bacterium]|nr:hypothetical protein [Planctomycetales bacterium]